MSFASKLHGKKGRIDVEKLEIKIGIGIDGISLTKNPDMGSIKRIVIEWAQRICSEKELFRVDGKGMLRGNLRK